MTTQMVALFGDYPVKEIAYTVASYAAERAGTQYTVSVDDDGWHCTCPDHAHRHRWCKHIRDIQAGNRPAGKPRIRVDWQDRQPREEPAPAPAPQSEMPARIREILTDLYGD